MNRGSATGIRAEFNLGHCFNEAPIHESGKLDGHTHPASKITGFNEAPIHESGKSVRCGLGTKNGSLASMRPRFMNRGSLALAIREVMGGIVASMRPRFMNRGSPLLGSVPAAARPASMRPRFMNRGSGVLGNCSDGSLRASMRPRFMNRGSPPLTHGGAKSSTASMRPRFMNRGSAVDMLLKQQFIEWLQ